MNKELIVMLKFMGAMISAAVIMLLCTGIGVNPVWLIIFWLIAKEFKLFEQEV